MRGYSAVLGSSGGDDTGPHEELAGPHEELASPCHRRLRVAMCFALAMVPLAWLSVTVLAGDRSLRVDGLLVLSYLGAIMAVGISKSGGGGSSMDGDGGDDRTTVGYFLAGRTLRWPSIAMSVIATNIDAGQFIGYAGGAYSFGLSQAQFEWSAVVNILVCVFCFVPGFIAERCTTITQFLAARVGTRIALLYSVSNVLMFSTMVLGGGLFWGAYLLDALFAQFLFAGAERTLRLLLLGAGLGVFSAVYTAVGGMAAVVRTDVLQCLLMLGGGVVLTVAALMRAGGWANVTQTAGPAGLLSVHLPADHPVLPWTGTTALFLIGLNYWGANQVVLQRALAARSLRDAQLGLLVGGCLKFCTGLLITLPAVCLRVEDMQATPPRELSDPDQAYMIMLQEALPVGARGLVLCGLFASLMSSVDSTLNSIATMVSVDLYARLQLDASEAKGVAAGRVAILVALCAGVCFLYLNIYVKLLQPDFAIINFLTELRYYFTNGYTVLVLAAFFLRHRHRQHITDLDNTDCVRTQVHGGESDRVSGQASLGVALGCSVLLFGASRVLVDRLPKVFQPYLVRAAITIGIVFASLILHDRNAANNTLAGSSGADTARGSNGCGGARRGEARQPVSAGGVGQIDKAVEDTDGDDTAPESDDDAEETRPIAHGKRTTRSNSAPSRSNCSSVFDNSSAVQDNSAAHALVVSSGREVEAMAVLVTVLYLAIQIVLW